MGGLGSLSSAVVPSFNRNSLSEVSSLCRAFVARVHCCRNIQRSRFEVEGDGELGNEGRKCGWRRMEMPNGRRATSEVLCRTMLIGPPHVRWQPRLPVNVCSDHAPQRRETLQAQDAMDAGANAAMMSNSVVGRCFVVPVEAWAALGKARYSDAWDSYARSDDEAVMPQLWAGGPRQGRGAKGNERDAGRCT